MKFLTHATLLCDASLSLQEGTKVTSAPPRRKWLFFFLAANIRFFTNFIVKNNPLSVHWAHHQVL
jgi:hypothetical protein